MFQRHFLYVYVVPRAPLANTFTCTAKLQSENLSLPLHSTHITLLLSSMSLFVPANEKYKTYFGTSPPSRATVAVPLLSGRVRVEVIGFDDTPSSSSSDEGGRRGQVGNRSALHVQGLSYWAPANIGPYSQAVLVASRLHIAGQIPLIPASLTLPLVPAYPKSAYPHQATLALQHVGRIVQALRSRNATGGGWEGWVEGGVGWWAKSGDGKSGDGVGVVRDAWRIWTRRVSWCFCSHFFFFFGKADQYENNDNRMEGKMHRSRLSRRKNYPRGRW